MTLTRLGLRNLVRHPWRTTATVLGVALGIAAVLATLSIGANVEANLNRDLEAALGPADLLIAPGAGGRAVFTHDEAAELAAEVPGVQGLEPVLMRRAEPIRELDGPDGALVPGVDTGFQLSGRVTERAERLPSRLEEGRWPEAGEGAIALGGGFADARGISVGDELSFAIGRDEPTWTVVGLLDRSVGYATTNGGRVAIVPLDVLQEAFQLSGRVSHLEVLVSRDAVTEQVKAELERRLGDAYAVSYPAGAGEIAGGMVDTLQAGLLVLAASLLVLGGFMAYNTFMAGVVERTEEYALLRTVCLRRRDVARIALIESAWVSSAGVVVGLALGVLLSWLLTRLHAWGFGFEARVLVVPWGAAALAALVGVAIAFLAGLLPARAASATSPLAARRQAEATHAPSHDALGWALIAASVGAALAPWSGHGALVGAGLAMLLFAGGVSLAGRSLVRPALVLLGPALQRLLGVAGRLGGAFTLRSATRNGVAIGTVVVGTGLIVGVGAMVGGVNQAIEEWVDTTVVGDLFLTSPVSFPEGFAASAAALEGVDQVSGVGLRVVRFQPDEEARGRSVALILVDPARFHPESGFGRFQYVQGQGDDEAGYATLRDGDGVLAASTIQERYGVAAGDEVLLRTGEGFAPFRVGGVVVDFTGGGEAFVASIEEMDRFGGGTPDLYVLTVEEGADPAAVRDRLLEAFPELHLDATLNQAYREQIREMTARTFATTNLLLVLAAMIAALGVANTLGMNLSTRGRELAVLRTLGLTRGGVRRIVIAEGVVVVAVGAVLGVGFGLMLAHVVTEGAAALTGYQIAAVYPWGVVALALLASPLVGLLASLAPARRAARLPPVAALRGVE